MGRRKKTGARLTAFLMVLAVCMTVLCPSVTFAAKKDEITVMSNIGEQIIAPYLEAFEKKYPSIKVKYYFYDDYENSMQENFAEGRYGDVLFVPSFMSQEEYPNHLEMLGDYQELSEKYNYMESSKFIGNDVYGIPSSAYMAGILYNKEVFSKAGITDTPKSIDEFLDDLKMIKERTDAIPFYTNYSSLWTLQFWETFPFLEMTGDPDYRNNDFLYQRNPFSQGSTHYQVYKMLYDIVAEGLCEEDPKADDWETSKGMLNNGQIGCMAIGSWAVKQFKDAGRHGDNVAFMPFPNEVNGKQYMTISTDYCYAISKDSQHKEAARRYIDFMLDESGYALNQETLSMVKTDPYPEAYGDMKNVVLSSNSAANSQNYSRLVSLSKNLNFNDNKEAARVIEAAAGYSDETFDEIINDWNTRWESGRPADMEEEMQEDEQTHLLGTVVSEKYEVTLSDTEKSFLKAQGVIRVGYLKTFAPFQYEDRKNFCGLSRQLCDIISDTIGIRFTYIGYNTQEQLLAALEDGKIEIAAGLDNQDVSNQDIRFSKSYIEYTKVVVKNESTNVDQLESKKEAYVAGKADLYQGADGKEAPRVKKENIREAIETVDAGKADYMIGNYYSVDYYIKASGCEHVSVIPMSEGGALSLAFGKNVDSRLISICNKGLYAVPDSRIQVMLMDDLDPPEKAITIRQFIRANPLLTMGIILAVLLVIGCAVFMILRQRWISARKHAVDARRYEILASLMDEYVFEYNEARKRMHFDPKFKERFGIEGDVEVSELSGKDSGIHRMMEVLEDIVKNGQNTSEPFRIHFDDGTEEWYRLIVYAVKDEWGVNTHLIGKFVSAQKEVLEQERMLERAQTDPLTGLYNRDGFNGHFDALEVKDHVVFAMMDIDNFKGVNDELGHAGGDRALVILADCLKENFPKNCIVSRFGGDEFILCMKDVTKDEAARRLNRLVKAMDRDMLWEEKNKHLSISLGAVYAKGKPPKDVLIREADERLYHVKESGKNNWILENLE